MELAKRLAAGLSLAAFAIFVVVWAPTWLLTPVVMALAGLSLWEFTRMALPEDAELDHWITIALGLVVVVAMGAGAATGYAATALAMVAICIHTTFRFGAIDTALRTLGYRMVAVIYAAWFISHYLILHPQPGGWQLILTTLVASYAGDTGAYFTGRFLGKNKMYPALSPKKTWEGFVGGVAASVFGVGVAKLIYFPELGWMGVVGFGVIFSCVAVVGDLVESLMKRAVGVKDSSNLIPGHGGFLDRLDSIVLSAPVVTHIGPLFL